MRAFLTLASFDCLSPSLSPGLFTTPFLAVCLGGCVSLQGRLHQPHPLDLESPVPSVWSVCRPAPFLSPDLPEPRLQVDCPLFAFPWDSARVRVAPARSPTCAGVWLRLAL